MNAWAVGGLLVGLVAVVVGAMVVRSRRRSTGRRAAPRAEPAQSDNLEATGYVPGVWLLGGADSAAPGHHAHGPQHGFDGAGSHAPDAGGTDGSGGGDGD
jgi:hypothetical protein